MRKYLSIIISIGAISLLLSVAVFAQGTRSVSPTADKYVISAEAGNVNFIEGPVTISRTTGRSGYLLKGDRIKIGDRISTEANSKVEVLLNPGSYLRLGGNSSFEFLDTSLDNLQVQLNRGSAMFEVITTNDFTFTIMTPKADFNVVKSGIYRVDVLEDGTGRIEVRKGRATIGDDDEARVKKGRSATVDGDSVAVERFDRGERDNLEEWSRDRAKQLDRINDRLERDNLRNSMIYGFDARRWSFYDSFGLWVYDPFSFNYCFVPFGYGWRSPYGYKYGRDIWYFRLPRYIYYAPPPPRTTRTTPPSTATAGTPQPGRTGNPRTRPPFQKIDEENGRVTTPSSTGFPTPRTPTTIFVPSETKQSRTQAPGRTQPSVPAPVSRGKPNN